ncbi:MAG: hypothetical protein R2852_08905 [Bacteroidia bacterium]
MKYLSLLIFTYFLLLFGLKAQENQFNNGFGFGFHLSEYQNDFGLGLNVTSPFFLHDGVGVRARANLMFNQNVVDSVTDFMPYNNLSIGFIGVGGRLGENIRLYGEGGFIAILPSSKFSSESMELGGYGLFGFEFFFTKFGNYFIEIGAVGTGAKADKVSTKPIYSNGLTVSTGVRFYLK